MQVASENVNKKVHKKERKGEERGNEMKPPPAGLAWLFLDKIIHKGLSAEKHKLGRIDTKYIYKLFAYS